MPTQGRRLTRFTRFLVERDTTPRQQRAYFAVLLVLLAAVNYAEYVTPKPLRAVLAVFLVPLLGSLVLGVARTAVLAVIASASVAVAYAVVVPDGNNVSEEAVALVSTCALGLLAILISRLGDQRQLLLQQARTTAEAVQLALLRKLPLRTKDFEVYGVYLAAEEYARVGGDLYEVIESPFGTRVLVADVRGKGLDAINAGATVLSAFRVAGYEERDLAELTRRMENSLDRYNEYAADAGQEERHVTALLVEFDPSARLMRLVNCGHLEPYIVGRSGALEVGLGEAGLPLGFGSLVDDPERPVVELQLPPDAWMLMFTDGVTEARDEHGDFYPLARRLEGWTDLEPAALAKEIERDLGAYVGGRLQDDAAILVVAAR
ncbi:PP2C family protein-serine/threonine phosphatase [Streptomyces beijiangensis]|uniref:Serine/threonine-protein phosphatase n=1 Tax=Streptomyces beijiangensis TaxID=163361 RepID=A0A939F9Q1_9ACTN|nr:PP2C family protein-serine/threonine phosphatase [Streptomyces beijiangensis]MBO0514543.1 serine/threonine-protein phosphatase [Streptomyces beijiangensis]